MSDQFKITLAQLNATVGDLKGNAEKVMTAWEKARDDGSNIIAFPELFITGYNPQDLILKPAFQKASADTIKKIAGACSQGPAIAVGGPFCDKESLYNAYYILFEGKIQAIIKKHHLPNEEVFDEVRLFSSGNVDGPFQVDQMRIGSPICEDAWHTDIVETLAETGAQTLLVPNGSPYYRGKTEIRQNAMVSRVVESGLPLVYLNLVGGQDDQVFDGGSFVLNPGGEFRLMLYAKYSFKLFDFMQLSGTEDFSKAGEIIQYYSEAQLGCPRTLTYTFRQARELLREFDVYSMEKDFIFKYDIPEYIQGNYVIRDCFKNMTDEQFREMCEEVGWNLMIKCRKQ